MRATPPPWSEAAPFTWGAQSHDAFTDAERGEVLEHRIRELLRQKLVVLSRSAFSAQLVSLSFGSHMGSPRGVYVSVGLDGRTVVMDTGGNAETLPAPRRR